MQLYKSTCTILYFIGLSFPLAQANNRTIHDILIGLDVVAGIVTIGAVFFAAKAINKKLSHSQMQKLQDHTSTLQTKISQLPNPPKLPMQQAEKTLYAAGLDHANTVQTLNSDAQVASQITSQQQEVMKGVEADLDEIRKTVNDINQSTANGQVDEEQVTDINTRVNSLGRQVSTVEEAVSIQDFTNYRSRVISLEDRFTKLYSSYQSSLTHVSKNLNHAKIWEAARLSLTTMKSINEETYTRHKVALSAKYKAIESFVQTNEKAPQVRKAKIIGADDRETPETKDEVVKKKDEVVEKKDKVVEKKDEVVEKKDDEVVEKKDDEAAKTTTKARMSLVHRARVAFVGKPVTNEANVEARRTEQQGYHNRLVEYWETMRDKVATLPNSKNMLQSLNDISKVFTAVSKDLDEVEAGMRVKEWMEASTKQSEIDQYFTKINTALDELATNYAIGHVQASAKLDQDISEQRQKLEDLLASSRSLATKIMQFEKAQNVKKEDTQSLKDLFDQSKLSDDAIKMAQSKKKALDFIGATDALVTAESHSSEMKSSLSKAVSVHAANIKMIDMYNDAKSAQKKLSDIITARAKLTSVEITAEEKSLQESSTARACKQVYPKAIGSLSSEHCHSRDTDSYIED